MKRFAAPLLIVAAIFIGFTHRLGRRPAGAARRRRRVHRRAGAGRPGRVRAAVRGVPRPGFSRIRRRAIARRAKTSAPSGDRARSTSSSPTSSRRCRRPIRARWVKKARLHVTAYPAADQRRARRAAGADATRRNADQHAAASGRRRRLRPQRAVAAAGVAAARRAAGRRRGHGGARGRGGERNRGVTVPGEVKNYVPVTPEMLRNPPPGDWLIFRRNYQGHSHSPLNQITPANVKNLQLQWVWAMNDSGANQTTPIVHNGIIYLATPSNIVQALDGKTGSSDLGNARGPGPGAGLRRHPQHRDCRRQDLPAGEQRAHGGVERAQRRDSVGHECRAGGDSRQYERRDRHRQQGAARADRLHALRRRRLLHQRVRHQHRQAGVAVLHDSAARASPAARRGASCR